MLDDRSRSDTIPAMDIRCDAVDVGHEAKIGRISEEAIFYLMSRGMTEEDARALIVGGFAEPIAKELSAGIRGGDEQPHPSGDEGKHWLIVEPSPTGEGPRPRPRPDEGQRSPCNPVTGCCGKSAPHQSASRTASPEGEALALSLR